MICSACNVGPPLLLDTQNPNVSLHKEIKFGKNMPLTRKSVQKEALLCSPKKGLNLQEKGGKTFS